MFASGLALALCVLAACALAVPGFVLGAEAPSSSSAAEIPPSSSATEPQAEAIPPVQAKAPAEEEESDDEALSRGTLFAHLPWGAGEGEVGLQNALEGLSRGPEAVAVAPDGRVAILDSVNSRLVLLDAEGSFTGSLALRLAEPRFLAASNEALFVLDCDADRRLEELSWAGEQRVSYELPALEDVVTGFFATDRGPCVETGHARNRLLVTAAAAQRPDWQQVPGRPLDRGINRAATVTFSPARGLEVAAAAVESKGLRALEVQRMRLDSLGDRPLEHLVSVDGDSRGGLVIGARLLQRADASERPGSVLVTRWARLGEEPEAQLVLPDCTFTYVGQPYVMAPDGRLIQPTADETGYSLLVHSFAEQEVGS